MNETAPADLNPTCVDRIANPLYFDSGGSRLFGWLHPSAAQHPPTIGVVICNPLGHELICAHRSIREFAQGIAALGIPTLRFDYLGTGDSAEVDENADHLAVWVQDVVAAVGEMRRRTGVSRICLLGVRLGALIAALAAAKCELVQSLILIGPVVSGSKYLREMRTAQLANLALSSPANGDNPEVNPTGQLKLEVGGFPISPITIQALTAAGLPAEFSPALRSVLILDNDKLPTAKRWADVIARPGLNVKYNAMSGLIEMAMTAPQFGTPPRRMIDETRLWLKDAQNFSNNVAEECVPPASAPPGLREFDDEHVLMLTMDGDSQGPTVAEHPVCIPASAFLFGIISEPIINVGSRRAVILLNSGADFHIGASRMYVSVARKWALNGYLVLRLDLAGIGDSATKVGNANDDVFPVEAVDDIRRALDYLTAKYSISEITLAGLCSGAYHALRAAAAGLPVNQILMVNPQNYFWDRSATLQDITPAEVVHNPGLYRRRLLSPQALLRIARGQVNVWRAAKICAHGLFFAGEAIARNVARALHIHLPNDLGRDLERIVGAGIRVVLIFSRGEPGINLLKLQAGKSLARLGNLYSLRILEAGDHIFSRREHRIIMERVLSDDLFALSSVRTPGDARNSIN